MARSIGTTGTGSPGTTGTTGSASTAGTASTNSSSGSGSGNNAGDSTARTLPARRQQAIQRQRDCVLRAGALIAQSAAPLSLAELAQQVGMSPYHFHRVFREITGLTPYAYAAAHRAQQVRLALAPGSSVTDALYEAGFQSSSRFYASAPAMLGLPPRVYRDGGAQARIHFAVGQCSLGAVLVAQSARGICALLLGEDPQLLLQDLQQRFPHADLRGGEVGFERTVAQVVGFIDAPGSRLDLPLDMRGTLFQQRVWQALCDIPAGSTVSYTEIARRIGAPAAVRAVAGACAANALAVAIPCHRVVRSDGALSGYRWGIARKRALLAAEAAAACAAAAPAAAEPAPAADARPASRDALHA